MNPIINLPFWETVRRSYIYAAVNFKTFLKLASLWLLVLTAYEILTGFPSLCNNEKGACPGIGMTSLLQSLAFILISTAYIRSLVLHRQPKWFSVSFGMPELRYIGYALLIIAVIAVPSLLFMYTYGVVVGLLRLPQSFGLLMLLFPVIIAVYCSRLYLVLPATAVGNKDVDLRKAWNLACGNANKIFWGLLLMTLPIVAGLIVLSVIYNLLPQDNLIIRSVIAFFWVGVTLFDAALKGSFYGHMYQYFMYWDERLPQSENKASTINAE